MVEKKSVKVKPARKEIESQSSPQKRLKGIQGTRPPARVSIVETVYHQAAMEQPTSTSSRFNRFVDSEEPPYVRPAKKIGEDWTPLELSSHIKEVSFVLIQNLEGKFHLVVPTPEMRAEAKERIIEVITSENGDDNPLLVFPGESLRISPYDAKLIRIRCQSGEANTKVIIYPK
jgi:hypothetical protein